MVLTGNPQIRNSGVSLLQIAWGQAFTIDYTSWTIDILWITHLVVNSKGLTPSLFLAPYTIQNLKLYFTLFLDFRIIKI